MNNSTYSLAIEKFRNLSLENYIDVIEIFSTNIRQKEWNVRYHYIKSITLFGLATLI